MELKIRVVCTHLPGREFQESGSSTLLRRDIHLGVQRGETVEQLVAADCSKAEFDLTFPVQRAGTGKPNFTGPYAKGTRDARFFYLVWMADSGNGHLGMFRRAKVHLSDLPWERVEAAAIEDRPLKVSLEMTDAKGGPKCASVKANEVRWSL